MRNRKEAITDELYGNVLEEGKDIIPTEDSLISIGKQLSTSNVGGDLGVLAYLQALQNLNASNQYFLKKLMETPSNSGVTAEEIRGIVKSVVSEIMKELGAEVK
jgi:hypothetical protein